MRKKALKAKNDTSENRKSPGKEKDEKQLIAEEIEKIISLTEKRCEGIEKMMKEHQ